MSQVHITLRDAVRTLEKGNALGRVKNIRSAEAELNKIVTLLQAGQHFNSAELSLLSKWAIRAAQLDIYSFQDVVLAAVQVLKFLPSVNTPNLVKLHREVLADLYESPLIKSNQAWGNSVTRARMYLRSLVND